MSAKLLFIFAISILQLTDCWIFNDVRYSDLLRRGLIRKEQDKEISPEELARLRFSLIFPGTKWCGPGNIADNYNDLGTAVETDKCCRDHDHCKDVIDAGETKYNLTNEAFYSRGYELHEASSINAIFVRLSCQCDETLRHCLNRDGSETSTTIGLMYFNLIGTQCFRKDYNATGCKEYGGWLNTKCIEYEYDTTTEKFYQWFDVPNY